MTGTGDTSAVNAAMNNEEIRAGKALLASKPVRLSVSLTRACNLDCLMCPDDRAPWEIPGHTAGEIRELLPYLRNVQWQGGEVFLSKHFRELFDAARACPHLRQNIITNALLLDEEWIERIAGARVTLELSIDGVTRATYERIRRGARFDDLLDRLKLIQRYRRTGAVHRDFRLKMHFVVMSGNAQEVGSVVGFAERYGIQELLLDKVIDFHDEELFAREDVDRHPETLRVLREAIPGVARQAREAGITLHHYFPESGADGRRDGPGGEQRLPVCCGVPWRRLTISPGGEVKPGCACRAPAGNVKDDTLMDIWNNAEMQRYRGKILRGECAGFCSPLCLGDRADRDTGWEP